MSTPPSIHDLTELLVSQSRDVAYILMDPEGVIVGWLGAAELVFGYTPEEALGRPMDFVFSVEDRERGQPRHELALAKANTRADDDRWHQRKDGTRIWVSGVTIPLRDRDDRIAGYAKVARDRTDLKAQLDALFNRVQAHHAAEEERTLFLRTLGHEIRNPLGPLTSAAALLRRVVQTPPALASLAVIDRQLTFIKRLADDLTDLTRIEAGRLEMHIETVRLQDLLQGLVDAYQPEAQRRGCDLLLLTTEAGIDVEADPERLQQIVMNLLQNALKFTPRGGRIWIKATTEAAHAVIRVEDTGAGIAPETLPRIFELFTQESPNSAESGGGLGIGLALVANLARLHGGVTEVRSPGKGKGSEFTVRLPLRQSARACPTEEPPPGSPRGRPPRGEESG